MAKLDRIQAGRGYDVEAVRYLNRARKAAGSIDADSEASVTWLLSAANVLATLDLADAIRSQGGDLGGAGGQAKGVASLADEANAPPDTPARAQ
jgi:hypothetical protein